MFVSMSISPAVSVSLAPHTTFGIGGAAQYFLEVADSAELQAAYEWAAAHEVPVTILGGGSNVLVADSGVPGLVVCPRFFGQTIEAEDATSVVVSYGAGEVFDEVVAASVAAGWWGLENLSHIPGTVGATPIQNVGAYGVEVADCIAWVEVWDPKTATGVRLTPAQCAFGYRSSLFKTAAGSRYVIMRVAFRFHTEPTPRLSYGDLHGLADAEAPPSQALIRDTVISIRATKFPDWTQVGTAGSFFKNPIVDAATCSTLRQRYPEVPVFAVGSDRYKIALGWILDRVCGYRGYRVGAVGASAQQALVVVNYGGATATAVHAFATAVATEVYERTGLTLEWEVTQLPKSAVDTTAIHSDGSRQ